MKKITNSYKKILALVFAIFLYDIELNAQYVTKYSNNIGAPLFWDVSTSWDIASPGAFPPDIIDNNVVVTNSITKDGLITVNGGIILEIYSPKDMVPPAQYFENLGYLAGESDGTTVMTLDGNLELAGNGTDTSMIIHPGAELIITGVLIARGNAILKVEREAKLTVLAGIDQRLDDNSSVGKFEIIVEENADVILNGGLTSRGTVDFKVDGRVTMNGDFNFFGDVDVWLDESTGYWYQNGYVDFCKSIWNVYDSLAWENDPNRQIIVQVDPSIDSINCTCWDGPPDAFDAPGCGSSLPVELLSYKAKSDGAKVELTWQTAWEEVNDYFTIERSPDGINYSMVGRVNGQGTTSKEQDYSFTDHTPLLGLSYYKLSQTDFDGTTEVLGILPVNHSGLANAFRVYPNPVQDEVLSVQLSGLQKQKPAHLRILDLGGREILSKVMPIANGFIDQTISLEGLNRGVYVLTVAQGTKLYRERIVKQ